MRPPSSARIAALCRVLFALALGVAGPLRAEAQTPAPVADWRFDDALSAVVQDSSPNGNVGSFVPTGTLPYARGLQGSALRVEGIGNQRAQVPDSPSLQLSGPLSVEAVVYVEAPLSSAFHAPIVAKWGEGLAASSFGLFLVPGTAVPTFGLSVASGASPSTVVAPQPLTLYQWHHVVGTYDGVQGRLYVDGVLVASEAVAGTVTLTPSPVVMGSYDPAVSSGTSGVQTFTGRIDRAAVYGAALADADVQTLANEALNVRAIAARNGSDTVAVVDVAGESIVADVNVGSGPFGVAIHPEGHKAYVGITATNTVAVIDTATNVVTNRIPLGGGAPWGMAIHPTGSQLFVANRDTNTLSVIDTFSETIVAILGVGVGPQGVAVSRQGDRVYVTNAYDNSISVIDPVALTVVGTIPSVGGTPASVAVSRDGTKLYVSNTANNTVSILDAATGTGPALAVGAFPRSVTISPDGANVYVANENGGSVTVIDTASDTVVVTVPVSAGPVGVAVTPDNTEVWVTPYGASQLDVVDRAANAVSAVVLTGAGVPTLGQFIGATAAAADAPAEANLAVSMTTPGTVLAGQNLHYDITVTNAGPNPALDARLSDTVPPGTGFVAVSTSAGACTAPLPGTGGTVTCAFGTLASGASAIVSLTIGTSAPGTVTNTAAAAAASPDPLSGDNVATVSSSVMPGVTVQARTIDRTGVPIAGQVSLSYGSSCDLVCGASPQSAIVAPGADVFVQTSFGFLDQPSARIASVAADTTYVVEGLTGVVTGTTATPGTTRIDVVYDVIDLEVRTVDTSFQPLDGTVNVFRNTDCSITCGASPRATTIASGAWLQAAGGWGYVVSPVVTVNPVLKDTTYRYDGRTGAPLGTAATPGVQRIELVFEPIAVEVSTVDSAGQPVAGSVHVFRNTDCSIACGSPPIVVLAADGAWLQFYGGYSTLTSPVATINPVSKDTTYRIDAHTGSVIWSASPGVTAVKIVFGAEISGTVRRADTAAVLPGAFVNVFNASTNAFVKGLVADTSGVYTTGSLPPGSYKIQARVDGFAVRYYAGATTLQAATAVSATGVATTAGIDLSLPAGAGGIIGTVSDGSAPIAGAVVDVYEHPSNQYVLSAATQADGTYATGHFLAGTYKIKARVNPPLSYVDTFYTTVPDGSGVDFATASPVLSVSDSDVFGIDIVMPAGGVINGVVVDRASGNPIAGASVIASRVAGNSYFGQFGVLTDAGGGYRIRGLRDGEWLVRVAAAGYVGGYATPDANVQAPDGNSATPIRVALADSHVADMNLRAGGGSITGQVTRSDSGAAVAFTNVSINGLDPRLFWTGFVTSTTTDATGNYQVHGLPAGQYVVQAGGSQATGGTAIGFYPGGAGSFSSVVPVSVSEGGSTVADFAIPGFGADTPRTISGTVTDAAGAVRFASVHALRTTTNGFVRSTATNGDGSYTLTLLPPGRYLLRVQTEDGAQVQVYDGQHSTSAGTEVDVTAASRSGVNFALPGGPGRITGRVVRADTLAPVTGANILLRTFSDTSAAAFSGASRHDGTFVVRGVPPGFYKLRIQVRDFLTGHVTTTGGTTPTFNDGAFLQVTGGGELALGDIALQPAPGAYPGGSVRGVVREAGTNVPLGEAVVQLRDAATGAAVITLITAADGSYEAPHVLPAGAYQLVISAAGHAIQWAFDRHSQAVADTVAVTADTLTTVPDIFLSPVQGSISGRVLRADLSAVADAAVVAFDPTNGGGVRRSGVTDTQGNYTLAGLAPGTYVLQAQALGYSRAWYAGAATISAATPVSVVAGTDQPGVDLTLATSSGFAGSIFYAGALTGAVRVEALVDGPVAEIYGLTVPDAAFPRAYDFLRPVPDTQGIRPGSYYVRAYIDGNGNGVMDAFEAQAIAGPIAVPEGVTVPLDLTLTDPIPDTPVADAYVTVAANATAVTGSELTYTLTVGNNGPDTAADLSLSDVLPSGTSFVSADFGGQTCTVEVTLVSCANLTLAAGASVTLSVTVQVIASTGALVNTATITSATADLVSGNNTASATTSIVTGGTIAGTVSSSGGGVLAGAQVEAISVATNAVVASATSQPDGTYVTPPLAPGSYRVRASGAGYAEQYHAGVTSYYAAAWVTIGGSPVTGVDFTLTAGAGTLRGVVTRASDGAVLAGATIDILAVDNTFVDSGFATDASGAWSVNLPPGSYKVRASLAGYATTAYNGKRSVFSGADVIGVLAGGTSIANIALPAGGGIAGHVAAADGLPVTGWIEIFDVSLNNAFVNSSPIDLIGNYTTGLTLAPGNYRVRANVASPYATTVYNDKLSVATGDAVSVTADAIHDAIDFVVPRAGSLGGRVTSTAGGGIAGAVVDFFDTSNQFVRSATSDLNGDYATALAPGTYKLKARVPAPASFVETFHATGGAAGVDFLSATPVTVAADGIVSGIDIALAPGGVITGVLTESDGTTPVTNATVFVSRPNAQVFFGAFTARPDGTGHYVLRGLRDGLWQVRVEAPGHVVAFASGDPAQPATDSGMATSFAIAGGNTIVADMRLTAGGGQIKGQVLRSDSGAGLAGAAVQALFGQFARPSFVVQATTDVGGNYTLAGLAPGPYIVQVVANPAIGLATSWYPTGATSQGTAVPFDVGVNEVVTGKDFVASIVPLYSISGVVRDALGSPLTAAFVSAVDPLDNFSPRGAAVNGDGSYRITGLPAGSYVVRTTPNAGYQLGLYDQQSLPFAAQVVTLAGTTLTRTGIDFTLGTGGTVTGRVTESGTGRPIAGAYVNLRNHADSTVLSVASQRDGTFVLRSLPPGVYKLRAMEPAHVTRWYTASGVGGATADEASFITVAAGQTTSGIELAMDAGGGRLRGRVFYDGSVDVPPPVVGGIVALTSAATGGGVTVLITRADGSYDIPGLASGDYRVRLFGVNAANEYFADAPTRETATAVHVLAPATVTLGDARLSPTVGTFSGRVLASDGVTPVADASIVAFDAAGGFIGRVASTDTDGRYTLRYREGLAPGALAYVAQARALGYATSFFAAGSTGAPSLAGAARFGIVAGADTPAIDFRLTRSSDLTGAVAYGGLRAGPLVVELFTDAELTSRAYRQTIAAPEFPQAFGFMRPPPDTAGIQPGQYWMRAFLDASPNGVLDSGEPVAQAGPFTVSEGEAASAGTLTLVDAVALVNLPPVAAAQALVTSVGASVNLVLSASDAETAPANLAYVVSSTTVAGGTLAGGGQFWRYTPPAAFTGTDSFTFSVTDRGNPDGCGTPSASCAAALGGSATVTIAVQPAGTTAFATSVELVTSPAAGGSAGPPQLLGDVEIDETVNGSLSTTGTITLTLPSGLTFAPGTAPSVSTRLSNGLTVGAPSVSSTQLSFGVTSRSTAGPAKLLISGIEVVVAPGFVGAAFDSLPVVLTVGGTNAGITPAQVTNGTAIRAGTAPVLDKVAPARAAQGVEAYELTLTGVNFAAGAAVAINGGGVSVGVPVVVSDSEIRVAIGVAGSAELTARDVTVTQTGPDGVARSSTLGGALLVTPPPSVLSTDRGPANPLRRGRTTQRINIGGAGFASPTTSPPNLFVALGTGAPFAVDTTVFVETVGFTDSSTIFADVSVAVDAPLGARLVRVINPDGGVGVSAVSLIDVQDPTPDTPPTLNAPASKTTTTTTATPSITGLSPNAALLGAAIVVSGSSFSTTATSNSVTFAAANSTRVSGAVTLASGTSLTVLVPSQAVDGNVTVAVNGVVSNAVPFTVTSPRLSSVIPSGGDQGTSVSVQLTGSKFVPGATVSVTSNGAPVTGVSVGSVTVAPTAITATFTLAATAPLGLFDVTVRNADGGTATLPAGFEVRRRSQVAIALLGVDTRAYLPSVGTVNVTLDATGRCTAKTVASVPVGLQVTYNGTTPPALLRVRAASSTLPGTALNEDCEPGQTPGPDFTIGLDDGTTQSVDVPADVTGGSTYTTTLFSRDMGGTVTLHVLDPNNNELGVLKLPVDSDNDGLPDAWEQQVGLSPSNADENGNGVMDDDDRFARDGLTNFDKYRGVYLTGPARGTTGVLGTFMRLQPRQRHLFVRGRGYGNDPAVMAMPGTCGWDRTNDRPVPDPTLTAANPCAPFEVGGAFAAQGIRVVDVTGAFVTGVTELPRVSMADPTRPILDMVTMTYDAVTCNGTEACDQTSKGGVRQWSFATLGVSTYGGATAYGSPRVVKRAIESYFNTKPYEHRTNDPTRIVTAPDGRPMLAPITLVGDGNDNGLVDRRDVTVNGELAGDTYVAGVFDRHLSAVDVNNDGCVELPQVGDPTTLTACDPTAPSGSGPQATKRQVVRHVTTHELGHAVGVNLHTTESDCVMYQYSTDWVRDGHFGPTAAPLLQIHNKGGAQ